MDILLCGNFEPSLEYLEEIWKTNCPKPKEKYDKGMRLAPLEQLLHISEILSKEHNIYLARAKLSKKYSKIKNPYIRTFKIMKDVDLIIIVMNSNEGGVMIEHGISSVLFRRKTLNFIKKGVHFSGMVSQGTMLLGEICTEEFISDKDLVQKIKNEVKSFNKINKIKNIISK